MSGFKAGGRLGLALALCGLIGVAQAEELQGQNEIHQVAGQQYDYIVQQMLDFKARKRTNDAGSMTRVAQTLSETDIENLAHYITSLR